MTQQEDAPLQNWPESRPFLTSDRLVLRAPTHDDAPSIASMFENYDVARMTGSIPAIYHPHAANGWVSCCLGGFARRRRIDWVIVEKDSLDVIGSIGLFKRSSESPWEIGYSLCKSAWGNGFATEAAQAVMNWAAVKLGLEVLAAGHFCDNPASGRILQKLGFVQVGDAVPMYSLARGEKAPGIRYIWPVDKTDGAQTGRLH